MKTIFEILCKGRGSINREEILKEPVKAKVELKVRPDGSTIGLTVLDCPHISEDLLSHGQNCLAEGYEHGIPCPYNLCIPYTIEKLLEKV